MKNLKICCAPITALILLLTIPNADAQVVPFKGSGMDSTYSPVTGDFSGFGKSTHMGRTYTFGNVQPDGAFFPEPGVFFAGTFTGVQVLIAANGDSLAFDIDGEVVLEFDPDTGLVVGTWTSTTTITGGTGRFANASGSAEVVATNPPFDPIAAEWLFDYSFNGKINLGKRK